jgi:hypothetical protein
MKMHFKLLVISISLTLLNWSIIYYGILKIPFIKYLLIESIWIISFKVFQLERKRLRDKIINK